MKLSQEELAFRIGTSQKQVSRYERGENDPTGEVLAKIADALETTTDWLLGRTEIAERPLRGHGDLDTSEREIIQLYRSKTPEDRRKFLDILKVV